MSDRLNFVLTGQDRLSRVLDGAGDSANRLARRLTAAATTSEAAVNRMANTTVQSLASMDRATGQSGQTVDVLRKSLLSLAPAAIPAAAAMAPLAAGVTAVGAATAAYALALGPQVSAMKEAAQAQQKYEDAVAQSGARSQEAIAAHTAYVRQMAKLPPATREAAVAVGILKDQYKGWSDSLSGDTMAPLTKGMAVLGAIMPKLTPAVRGTSKELDRLVTIAGGAVASPGFDRLMKRFGEFSQSTMRRANSALVSFLTRLDAGQVGGGLERFMDYARQHGPVVGDTLSNIGQALGNLLEGAAQAGGGMLAVINALSGIVAAVPPGAIALLLQLALAIKAVRLAALGLGAARTAMAGFGASVLAMQTAAAGATGRVNGLAAAFGAMSRGAKAAVAGTGIGLLLIALMELNERAKVAPPDVDKLTTSLKELGAAGRFGGELRKTFGDMDGFVARVNQMRQASGDLDAAQPFLKLIPAGAGVGDLAKKVDGLVNGTKSLTAMEGELSAFDQSFAQLATSGHADLAAQQFARFEAALKASGRSAAEVTSLFPQYKAAVASIKAEQQLAAQSMGVFGQQAQAVQAKLAAQKLAADGLTQSVHALNSAYLQSRGDVRSMESAIDMASEALRRNGRTLDENTAAGRENNAALDAIGATTMRAMESVYAQTGSWQAAIEVWERGRGALDKSTLGMARSKEEAAALAGQILRTPDKTAMLRADKTDLERKLKDARAQLKTVPDARKAQVKANIAQLEAALRTARDRLDALDGKTATTYVTSYSKFVNVGPAPSASQMNPWALPGKASGGLVTGPGTSTSDSIPTLLSDGEYVIRARSVDRYGLAFLDALNAGTLGQDAGMRGAGAAAAAGLAGGLTGATGQVAFAARVMASAVTTGVRAELQIASPSRAMIEIAKDVGAGLIKGLLATRAQISATAKDLAKDIANAFRGQRTTLDDRLIASVNRTNTRLQSLAAQRDAITAKIKQAGEFATGLITSARQSAGLSNLGMSDEEVTLGGITSGLGQKLARIQQFTRYVQILAKRGLNKGLLQQILNMGPESGYAYASALAGAGTSALRQVNSLQGQLDDATQAMGRAGADAMYDTGKQAGRGYLDGLMSQRTAIEKAMLDLAKSMQRAIKKALGIKSPSRVMAELGRYSTQGLAVGMTEGLPALDRTVTAVASRMAPRGMTHVSAGRGVAVGGTVREINAEFHIHGAMDPQAVAREIQKVMLQMKRNGGQNWGLGLG
ncbi:hypothetical protein [Streptomyces sp. NRRL S-118]|uniref:hypothetical protein n=1 Tax=Streptomyces sp. NRRL S-118 TaxID=1463881 RepID=UPI0004C91002|nr:hypothetical protein [Streptomyces sp. NRRL S-118]